MQPFPLTTRNLTITSVSASGGRDWFLFDPETYDPNAKPSVQFTVDKLVAENATAELKVYMSEDTWRDDPVRTIQASVTTQGTYSIEWDGKNDSGAVATWGVYVFRLTVQSGTFPDSDVDKSATLVSVTDRVVQDEADPNRYRLEYSLADVNGRNASSCCAYVYDPALAEYGPTLAPCQLGSQFVDLGCDSDLAGTYIFLLQAVDDGATTHKGHRNRPALECNARTGKPPAVNVGQSAFEGSLNDAWGHQKACGYGQLKDGPVLLDAAASKARNKLLEVAIYCYFSHGPGTQFAIQGRMYFPKAHGLLGGKGEAVAINVNDSISLGPIANDFNWSYLSGLPNGAADHVLLAVFVGCGIVKQPMEGPGGGGATSDLMAEVRGRLLADAFVGFGTTNMPTWWGDKFMDRFWSLLAKRRTIDKAARNAAEYASSDPRLDYGDASRQNQLVTGGMKWKRIRPAAWGQPG